MTEEERLSVCAHLAHHRFRVQNENLTGCCKEPDHEGNHVYCVKVDAGIDYKSHSLHFHEEIYRQILKPIVVVEMGGRELSTDEECAAVFQFMELSRGKHSSS